MALIVDYNELEALGKSINTSANDWFGSLESISNAIQTLSGSSNIQGQAADNVKSYLNTVHSSIIAAFGSIMSAHAQNYLLYKREYQSDIDSALHARILQDEILRIQENVQKNKDSTQDVDITIKNAIADISDIIHLGFPGSGVVEGIEEDIIKDITELDNNIVAVENRHYRSDFTETTQLLDALEQLLHQQLGTQRHYKSNFSIDSLGSNKAFLDFAGALSTLAQVQEGKSDAVERAYAEEEQWQERLYEERQREAETINWLVTGLCIVGSVVAIVATGGAATPLVVATISGISGAVSAGTQSLTSQYVETGDWGDTNWAEVGKDAFIGGLAGFATGYIGTAGSQAITSSLSKVQPVSQLLNSSSTATRVVSNFVVGAGTESLTGMGSRFAGTLISSNGDVEVAWNSATDVKSLLIDAGIGGSSGVARGFKKTEVAVDELITIDETEDLLAKRRKAYDRRKLKETTITGEDWCRYLRSKYGNNNVVWENATPSQLARSWQGAGRYPGVDVFTDIKIKKNSIVYRGEPKGTEFFTSQEAILKSDKDASKLFKGLQVEKNEIRGYRKKVVGYIVDSDTDVDAAIGKAVMNPQFGKGGLTQYYIPDANKLIESGILKPINEIELTNWR